MTGIRNDFGDAAADRRFMRVVPAEKFGRFGIQRQDLASGATHSIATPENSKAARFSELSTAAWRSGMTVDANGLPKASSDCLRFCHDGLLTRQ